MPVSVILSLVVGIPLATAWLWWRASCRPWS